MEKVTQRFLNYISQDTQSDLNSGTHPSSPGQLEFAKKLATELEIIGLKDVTVDEKAYVMATLPSNCNKPTPIVGFISHIDTSPDFTAKNANPQIIDNYNGEAITLNFDQNIIMLPSEFPELKKYIGQRIITTDGTTLLGADDKAGVAEIVTAMEYLCSHPEIEHGEVKIGFTPDEEIGEGADFFNVTKFGADFAYTLDGDELGVLEYENFNAAVAKITFKGRNVHPGYAKNKMQNSMLLANKFINLLPQNEIPQETEGYEGFYHLISMNGDVEKTEISFIIRDHDLQKFEKRKEFLTNAVAKTNSENSNECCSMILKDQYYNMLKMIKPVMHVVDIAKKSMIECGITPQIKAIRGGTDGARLSYMNLPCPNIFAGGHNFHGRFEFIPEQSMLKAVDVILKIIENVKSLDKGYV